MSASVERDPDDAAAHEIALRTYDPPDTSLLPAAEGSAVCKLA
jgi:hypothetical protein